MTDLPAIAPTPTVNPTTPSGPEHAEHRPRRPRRHRGRRHRPAPSSDMSVCPGIGPDTPSVVESASPEVPATAVHIDVAAGSGTSPDASSDRSAAHTCQQPTERRPDILRTPPSDDPWAVPVPQGPPPVTTTVRTYTLSLRYNVWALLGVFASGFGLAIWLTKPGLPWYVRAITVPLFAGMLVDSVRSYLMASWRDVFGNLRTPLRLLYPVYHLRIED